MKSFQIDRSNLQNKAFTIRRHKFPYFLKIWHYHTELELVVVLKSKGTRFIGDNIEQFKHGEIILIGKDLPHMWLNDNEYFEEGSTLEAEAIAVHFREDFAGKSFLKMTEMSSISDLLEKANFGIRFFGETEGIIERIENLSSLNEFDKIIEFIQILNVLARHKNYHLLSSLGFVNSFNTAEVKNLDKIYEYIIKNFKKTISLEKVASIAHMNPSAFSRFFKRVNRKTFTQYVSEIRIGYACKLLIENKYNVSEVCYESGFNNISNFNRQFKKAMNYSPSEYLKLHLERK